MNNKTILPRGCDSAKLITVIETSALRGSGEEEQPLRAVKQYWTLEGKFLAEMDPCAIVIQEEN